MKWCKIFGHKLELTCNSDEMWIKCIRKNCKHQEDVPENRIEEGYEKIRNSDYKWIKS